MTSIEKVRERRVKAAQARAGIHEGHYRLREFGEFKLVHVWVEFYPKEQWYIEDTIPPRAEPIPGTRRKLTTEVKAKLESWL